MLIRPYIPGDEAALWGVFRSSIHQLARGYYTAEQLEAWAPADGDPERWAARIAGIRPFVAVVDGHVAGYADLQASGYIDHFFVAGEFSRRGVGTALMRHLHEVAIGRTGQTRPQILFSDVSLAAEEFFLKHGFYVKTRQSVSVRGVSLSNARMVKELPLTVPHR